MAQDTLQPAQLFVLLGTEAEGPGAFGICSETWREAGFDVTNSTSLEKALSAAPEILIIAPGVAEPRRTGTVFRRKNPSAQVLFLVPEAEVERFCASLPFTPEIAGASAVACESSVEALQRAVAELIESGRSERAIKGMYGRLNEMVAPKAKPSAEDSRRRQLVLAERYLSTILTHAPEALFASDIRGRLVQLNRAAERLFQGGWEAGGAISSLFAEPSQLAVKALIERAVVGEIIENEEVSIDREGGAPCIVDLNIAPVLGPTGLIEGLSFSAHDITARRKAEKELRDMADHLEERVIHRTNELSEANRSLVAEMQQREAAEGQIRQMQKMEAVGQLTGGIAHDFNNMLGVVIGSLDLMKRRLDRGDTEIVRFISSAMEGANRATELTQRLLAFSRRQSLSPQALNANQMVSGMSELLRRTLGETVETETVLAGGLWQASVDKGQLENTIVNLAVNARDAMEGGGRLTIETANCHLDETYALEHGIPSGQYIMIAVTDTGTGMTPEVMAKAFDPFFTTKGVGKGTGLGLSQVFGFVKQSNGHIKIYSEPEQGTTMKIYLPRYYGPAEAEKSHAGLEVPAGSPSELILLVEDDPRVRALSTQMLRDLGYKVIEVANGPEALMLLQESKNIALLFTDVVMPGMNGRELADRATKLQPGLKVLFTTGYTRNAVVHNGVLDPGVHLLPKPATLEQMASMVRKVLDEQEGD